MNERVNLFDDYYARVVDDATIFKIMKENLKAMFPNSIEFKPKEVLDKVALGQFEKRVKEQKQPFRLNYLIEKDRELAGWCTSYEAAPDDFHMHNSGVFEPHKRKGLYSAVLKLVLEYAKNQGYLKVSSRHHVSNNAIIIPKLKAGFLITGFDVSEKFGLMLELNYFNNEAVKSVIKFRTGEVKLPAQLTQYINITGL